MKHTCALLAFVLLITFNTTLTTARAQGELTPPGAPAPGMKTLAQIEARTPISSAPFIITTPGSYYLTTNLTVNSGTNISISANNVMLDLNGFTLFSTEASAATSVGISVNGVTNVTIVHGYISGDVTNNAGTYSGSGFNSGINFPDLIPVNVRVSGVSVSGCRSYGIYLGNNSVVESCTVSTVGSAGIVAGNVSDSTAQNCRGAGVSAFNIANNCSGTTSGNNGVYAATANNCFGITSGSGSGVAATTANNCSGSTSGDGYGLNATTANNCSGSTSGGGYGLSAITATGCSGYSNGGTGVFATAANNCYGINGSGGYGITAIIATGCYGESDAGYGYGVDASTANNCIGYSYGSGTGVNANDTAIGCYGYGTSGTGIYAFIASVCHGATSRGTALNVIHNVNSF